MELAGNPPAERLSTVEAVSPEEVKTLLKHRSMASRTTGLEPEVMLLALWP